jgi:hypothetical protein
MPEPSEERVTAATERWAAYNLAMVALFAERDLYPMDSAERDAAVEKIMTLWVAEG